MYRVYIRISIGQFMKGIFADLFLELFVGSGKRFASFCIVLDGFSLSDKNTKTRIMAHQNIPLN